MDLHGNQSCILYCDYKRLHINKSLNMQCAVFALCCDNFSNKSAECVAVIHAYRGPIYSNRDINRRFSDSFSRFTMANTYRIFL